MIRLDHKPLFDVGQGQPILLLHGLFGNLSNWGPVVREFSSTHRVIVPRLPFYSTPILKERLDYLVAYISALAGAPELFVVGLIFLLSIEGIFPLQRWYLRFMYSSK